MHTAEQAEKAEGSNCLMEIKTAGSSSCCSFKEKKSIKIWLKAVHPHSLEGVFQEGVTSWWNR